MSEVSNSDLLGVLFNIREDLGTLKANSSNMSQQLENHISSVAEAHKSTAEDIRKLQLAAARQKGFLAALAGAGSVLGAGVGYAVDLLTMRGGHH